MMTEEQKANLLKDPKEREAYEKLDYLERLTVETFEDSYYEYWAIRDKNKNRRHPADYWETPPGCVRMTDPLTGEVEILGGERVLK